MKATIEIDLQNATPYERIKVLEQMEHKDLQLLAKNLGIKANQKKIDIINMIMIKVSKKDNLEQYKQNQEDEILKVNKEPNRRKSLIDNSWKFRKSIEIQGLQSMWDELKTTQPGSKTGRRKTMANHLSSNNLSMDLQALQNIRSQVKQGPSNHTRRQSRLPSLYESCPYEEPLNKKQKVDPNSNLTGGDFTTQSLNSYNVRSSTKRRTQGLGTNPLTCLEEGDTEMDDVAGQGDDGDCIQPQNNQDFLEQQSRHFNSLRKSIDLGPRDLGRRRGSVRDAGQRPTQSAEDYDCSAYKSKGPLLNTIYEQSGAEDGTTQNLQGTTNRSHHLIFTKGLDLDQQPSVNQQYKTQLQQIKSDYSPPRSQTHSQPNKISREIQILSQEQENSRHKEMFYSLSNHKSVNKHDRNMHQYNGGSIQHNKQIQEGGSDMKLPIGLQTPQTNNRSVWDQTQQQQALKTTYTPSKNINLSPQPMRMLTPLKAQQQEGLSTLQRVILDKNIASQDQRHPSSCQKSNLKASYTPQSIFKEKVQEEKHELLDLNKEESKLNVVLGENSCQSGGKTAFAMSPLGYSVQLDRLPSKNGEEQTTRQTVFSQNSKKLFADENIEPPHQQDAQQNNQETLKPQNTSQRTQGLSKDQIQTRQGGQKEQSKDDKILQQNQNKANQPIRTRQTMKQSKIPCIDFSNLQRPQKDGVQDKKGTSKLKNMDATLLSSGKRKRWFDENEGVNQQEQAKSYIRESNIKTQMDQVAQGPQAHQNNNIQGSNDMQNQKQPFKNTRLQTNIQKQNTNSSTTPKTLQKQDNVKTQRNQLAYQKHINRRKNAMNRNCTMKV